MRDQAPQHISLPSRVMSLSASLDGHTTPSPQTPMPYEGVESPSAGKREREEEEVQETTWSDEDLEVVQATLRHPFRPLSTPFPPGELPPPAILDELTNQILAYALRGSPNAKSDGWTHGWDATRKQVYAAALEASRTAHGIEKLSRAERASRPGLRRVDSMDFLDQADESVGSAIRSSTSLQNSAKPQPAPSTSIAPRKRMTQRATLTKAARPTSLLQRGRSYTANELQAETSVPVDTAPLPTPIDIARPARITRSQSSIIASKPPPHAARDQFLNSKPTLEPSFTLDVRSSPPSWSDSEDEEVKPKRRAVRKLPTKRRDVDTSGSDGSLQSPFEEKVSFL